MGIKNKSYFLLLLLIITAFMIRAVNFSFPAFTFEEARIAYRGYTLATVGTDELGRKLPVLFNSLADYQLPATSYLTAAGELIFGKSELGARIPFLVIGTALAFLVYEIAKFFSQSLFFRLASAFIVAFSPVLVFLSKTPNETILLVFIFALLFYLMISKKSLLVIMPVMILSVVISKQAWLILAPFTLFTLVFYQRSAGKKRILAMVGLSMIITFVAFTLFLSVPQSKRSLAENNFSIFSDITIKNGIDQLRGEGAVSNWPPAVDRLLFNKSHFLSVGLLHWLSHLSPALYFGQFDSKGGMNYSFLGAWSKVLLIPFASGVFFLIKKGRREEKLLVAYLLILTFPSILIYPNLSLELAVLTLPFMALIAAFGLMQFRKKIAFLILFLVIIELVINTLNLSADYKNTAALRPIWIERLAYDIFEKSKIKKVAVSDDIAEDLVPYIEWHTAFNPQTGFLQVESPYKFRQYTLADIKLIGSDESFNTCGKDEQLAIFASSRDLNKIKQQFEVKFLAAYDDVRAEQKAFLVEGVCIK